MATKPSKFYSIFEPDEEVVETPVIEKTPLQSIAAVTEQPLAPEYLPEPSEGFSEDERVPKRRTGRPATGKKSHPDYRQVTAYVRKTLYKDVNDTLNDKVKGQADAKRKEFSQLVDELLEQWWREQTGRKGEQT